MGERYVREVFDDDLHLADSSDEDGSHRGLQYDDDNNLKSHAKYYDVDERDIYDELREKYEDEDTVYISEVDIEDLQRKAEALFAVGAIAAGVIHYVSPYVKEWMQETAIPGVKTAFKQLRGKFKAKGESREVDIVEVSLDASEENSLAVANQIEIAEKEYREKMTSEEARQKFLRIVILAMELTKEVNDLSNADIQDEDALAKKDNWKIVEKQLTKESLLEGINNILESGEDAFTKEQVGYLQNMLGRNLYQGEDYTPIELNELQDIFGETGDGKENDE